MGKYKVWQGKDEQWYFKLVAPNGETIAVSEGYTTKNAALDGVGAVRRWAADAETVVE